MTDGITVLVCGGRNYNKQFNIFDELNRIHIEKGPIIKIIHGGSRGADHSAARWALLNGIRTDVYPAQWELYGRRAGPLRNAEMIKANPDIVLAAPGGSGTVDTVKRAHRAGILVIEIEDEI